ncbi:Ragulator complex protein LAMTOR3-A [Powellomyces hirtus]|nr:Ragulator complex protein LAMTOR3-A [Powellomyces hirtus]
MAELDALLESMLTRTEHVKAIMVTDRDGVILAKALHKDSQDGILEPAFSATFAVACEQCGKLGLGTTTSIISTFSSTQIVQFSHPPLILTLLASLDIPPGVLLAAGKDLADPMKMVAEAVARSTAGAGAVGSGNAVVVGRA